MVRIEGLDISREYCEKPFEAERAYSRLNISVVIYDCVEFDGFDIVRSHYESRGTHTPNQCDVDYTIEDSNENYLEIDEAYNAFSVQCVKAFTQQVTWHNAKKEAARQKEV